MPEFSKYLLDLNRDYIETGEWRWGERIVEVELLTGVADGATKGLSEMRPRGVGSSPTTPTPTLGGQPD